MVVPQAEGSMVGAKIGTGEVESTVEAKAQPPPVPMKSPEDDGVTRVQTMRKELEWMRSLQN